MIVTDKKSQKEVLESLKGYSKVFLMGCGECATACKTGGEDQVLQMKEFLQDNGKEVLGFCIPDAPCVAVQSRAAISKSKDAFMKSEAVVVLACGLGLQSAKESAARDDLAFVPACNTVFSATIDRRGNFYEKCSMCGECILASTGGICPVTLCPKGMMNGPCGGMNKGKCEVNQENDCAWALIYAQLSKKGELELLKKIRAPRDFSKSVKPQKRAINPRQV